MSFLVKPLAFFLIIVLGYLLMRFGFFKEGDQHIVSKIVLNITLPCAAIQAFGKADRDPSMYPIVLVGFLCALIPSLLLYVFTFRCSTQQRVFYMLNASGYNLGCFTLPMLQSFFSATGGVLVCIFDIGNAILATGGNYALVSTVLHTDGEKITPIGLVKKFFSSICLDTNLVMLAMMIGGIPIPSLLLNLTEPFGSANPFLAMLMLGMMIRPPKHRGYLVDAIKLLASRLALSACFSILILRFLPLPLEMRQIISVIPFAPIGAMTPVFTHKCHGDAALSSFVNSISVIISLILMPLLCMRFLV